MPKVLDCQTSEMDTTKSVWGGGPSSYPPDIFRETYIVTALVGGKLHEKSRGYLFGLLKNVGFKSCGGFSWGIWKPFRRLVFVSFGVLFQDLFI